MLENIMTKSILVSMNEGLLNEEELASLKSMKKLDENKPSKIKKTHQLVLINSIDIVINTLEILKNNFQIMKDEIDSFLVSISDFTSSSLYLNYYMCLTLEKLVYQMIIKYKTNNNYDRLIEIMDNSIINIINGLEHILKENWLNNESIKLIEFQIMKFKNSLCGIGEIPYWKTHEEI